MSVEDFLDKYKDDKNFEIIKEPFLTEDGFVNEACMNALSKAIDNMPKSYERLSSDPEWSEKRWTFKHDITGAFAKWAVRQSAYNCPSNIENVISYLSTCLEREVNWDECVGMAQLSLCDINKLLYDILYEKGISYFDDWNKAKKNWKETDYECLDRAEREDPDYGFIDLDALLHNVSLDIREERRANDKFDKEFEEEHKDDN
jgi:hypothetical protein